MKVKKLANAKLEDARKEWKDQAVAYAGALVERSNKKWEDQIQMSNSKIDSLTSQIQRIHAVSTLTLEIINESEECSFMLVNGTSMDVSLSGWEIQMRKSVDMEILSKFELPETFLLASETSLRIFIPQEGKEEDEMEPGTLKWSENHQQGKKEKKLQKRRKKRKSKRRRGRSIYITPSSSSSSYSLPMGDVSALTAFPQHGQILLIQLHDPYNHITSTLSLLSSSTPSCSSLSSSSSFSWTVVDGDNMVCGEDVEGGKHDMEVEDQDCDDDDGDQDDGCNVVEEVCVENGQGFKCQLLDHHITSNQNDEDGGEDGSPKTKRQKLLPSSPSSPSLSSSTPPLSSTNVILEEKDGGDVGDICQSPCVSSSSSSQHDDIKREEEEREADKGEREERRKRSCVIS